jgi:hypothetical protein
MLLACYSEAMADARTVFNTALDDIPEAYWANSILMRLCVAMGAFDPSDFTDENTAVEVDAEQVVSEACYRLTIVTKAVEDRHAADEANTEDAVIVEDDDGPE